MREYLAPLLAAGLALTMAWTLWQVILYGAVMVYENDKVILWIEFIGMFGIAGLQLERFIDDVRRRKR